MQLSNEQIANAYAIAKTLGLNLSVDDFQKLYSQYYNEAITDLNSKPAEYANCEAFKRPF